MSTVAGTLMKILKKLFSLIVRISQKIRASLPEPLPYGDNVIAIKLKNGSPDLHC